MLIFIHLSFAAPKNVPPLDPGLGKSTTEYIKYLNMSENTRIVYNMLKWRNTILIICVLGEK